MQDPDGKGYNNWANVSAEFARHWKDIGIPVFEEIWNEPDLVRAIPIHYYGTGFCTTSWHLMKGTRAASWRLKSMLAKRAIALGQAAINPLALRPVLWQRML